MRAYVLEPSAKRPSLVQRPDPVPGPGEVLVRATALSLHPVDLETAAGGNAPLLPNKRPFIPGVDFAGVVEALGAGTAGFAVGEAVYGYRGIAAQGAFAERLVVPAAELAPAPAGSPPEQLACLPLPALCALQAAEALSGPGRVLVHGGGGGVGSVAVQVFARLGHEVSATASAADLGRVRAWGAARVIDYQSQRFGDEVREQDLVLDTVGGEVLARSFGATRAGGTVVSLRAMPDAAALRAAGLRVPWWMGALLPLLRWGPQRKARAAGVRLIGQVTVPSGARLRTLTGLAAPRPFEVRIDRVFSFGDLPGAMDHLAAGARGRVVVVI